MNIYFLVPAIIIAVPLIAYIVTVFSSSRSASQAGAALFKINEMEKRISDLEKKVRALSEKKEPAVNQQRSISRGGAQPLSYMDLDYAPRSGKFHGDINLEFQASKKPETV